MKYLLLCIMLIIFTLSLRAQENPSVLIEKQQEKLEAIESKEKRKKLLKEYREQDSIRVAEQVKKLNDQGRQAIRDSLESKLNVPLMPTDSAIIQDIKSGAAQLIRDSLGNFTGADLNNIMLDSTLTDKIKSKAGSKIKSAITNETGIEVPQIDSAAIVRLKQKAEAEAAAALEEEFGIDISQLKTDSATLEWYGNEMEQRVEAALRDSDEWKSLPENSMLADHDNYKFKLEKKQEEIRKGAASKALKEKMTSQAKKFIQENADKIQKVQEEMGKLKQKYSYLPNSNDLSSAVKRSSLKGESVWKRLVVGGNFNISRKNPVTIDMAPVMGYKFNKLFEAGVTGSYRAQFSADKTGLNQDSEAVYGYSLFANHMVFNNFFGYLEGGNLNTESLNPEIEPRLWIQTLLVGAGRKFNVTKWMELQTLVLFNILHDNSNRLFDSPVVFKTAVRWRK